jgi:hypothetical protein
MDFGSVFSRAWFLTWRYKFLWIFGFFASLTALNSSILRLLAGPTFARSLTGDYEQWLSNPDLLFNKIDESIQLVSAWLVGGAVVLFLVTTAAWLIMTMAQGAIIGTAVAADADEPVSFSSGFKRGVGLLGRFVAIDTIVYFPVFLVLLIMMLLVLAALVGTAVTAFRDNATPTALITPLLVGIFCLIPFMCMLVPLGMLTAAFRALAFRDTAVLHTGVRQVVRHTWAILKPNFANALVLGLLLVALQYVLRTGLSLLTLPAYALVTAPGILSLMGESSPVTLTTLALQFVSIVIELFVISIQAVWHTFTAVVWTLAYKEMAKGSNQ